MAKKKISAADKAANDTVKEAARIKAAVEFYQKEKGVDARNQLSVEEDIEVLRALGKAEKRKIVAEKVAQRLRALGATIEDVSLAESDHIKGRIAAGQPPGEGAAMVAAGFGPPSSLVDEPTVVPFELAIPAPDPTPSALPLVPEPGEAGAAEPPKRNPRFTEEEWQAAIEKFGTDPTCSKCKEPNPLQLRRMSPTLVRNQSQCGACRSKK